ncbi:rhodanese-like domain-containing protein [Dyadobacter tibetensis]|uniref:rhodanese-like domain-containing protein n=1 Tax=Dyadobacter tibetensis TaxID=1211851 RepID=UPI0004ADC0D5|nr:rhodanese-like domain-containing protein [Dyadobacter tibetensis]
MGFLDSLFNNKKVDYKQLVKDGAVIVDVRSPQEYASGHITGSINIPLTKISTQVDALKERYPVIITCCASGNRSGMALGSLNKAGIEAYNGGSWNSLNKKINAV